MTASLFACGAADSATLKGKIDVAGQGPLADAVVRVDLPGGRKSYATRTAHDGTFSISGINSEKVLVTVQAGSATVYQSVVTGLKEDNPLNVTLKSSPVPEVTKQTATAPAQTLAERTFHRINLAGIGPYVYLYVGEIGKKQSTRISVIRSNSALPQEAGYMNETAFLAFIRKANANVAGTVSVNQQGERQRFTYGGRSYEIAVLSLGPNQISVTVVPI